MNAVKFFHTFSICRTCGGRIWKIAPPPWRHDGGINKHPPIPTKIYRMEYRQARTFSDGKITL